MHSFELTARNTMVTPREPWPKEAMFTLLYSLTLDVHVTVRVVLILDNSLFFYFLPSRPLILASKIRNPIKTNFFKRGLISQCIIATPFAQT